MNDSKGKIYRALVVDTNTFKASSFKFKKGKLSALEQFADSEFIFLMPEIIRREVLKHYEAHLLKARDEAVNKLKTIGNYNISLIDYSELLFDLEKKECDEVARRHFDEFIEATNAIELKVSEYGNLQEIVNDYFQNKPPFASSGDKKAEFPDAICLQLINNWSEKNGVNILAVSKDKDWLSYTDNNENIDLKEELEEALAIFVHQNKSLENKIYFITNLFGDKSEKRLNEIIIDSIKNNLDGKFFEVRAEADMGVELDFDSIKYLDHEIGNFNIVEVNLKKREILVNYLLNIKVELRATADFYHWDREDNKGYSLACESRYSEEVLTGDLTLKFMFPDDIEDILSIEDLDEFWLGEETLELETTYFDLGYIEPDFS